MDVSIQELMEKLPGAFVPEKATGIDATVLFQLSGEKGGEWLVTIQNNTCRVINGGQVDNPKLIFNADAQDCLDIFNNKLDGMKAYMQGRLKLTGNMGLAMRLSSLFRLDAY